MSEIKKCPKCESTTLVSLSSQNLKKCADCGTEFEWKLAPGQRSVLIEGLVGE